MNNTQLGSIYLRRQFHRGRKYLREKHIQYDTVILPEEFRTSLSRRKWRYSTHANFAEHQTPMRQIWQIVIAKDVFVAKNNNKKLQ
jgi:hypothetical protein